MGKFTATAFLAFTVGQALAQTSSVVSLFLLETDPQSLVASVVGVDASKTTYLLNCPGVPTDAADLSTNNTPDSDSSSDDSGNRGPTDTSSDECGVYNITVAVGESVWDVSASDGEGFSESIHCDMMSYTSPGTCTVMSISTSGDPVVTFAATSVYQPLMQDYNVLPVTITAGLEKLPSASARPTPSGSSASKTATSTEKGGSASPASSAGALASQTAAANNRGAPLLGAAIGAGAAVLVL